MARYNDGMINTDPTHIILDLMAATAENDKGRAMASDLEDLLDNDDNDAVARVLAVAVMAVRADRSILHPELDDAHTESVLTLAASL